MSEVSQFSKDRQTVRDRLAALCDGLDPRCGLLLERGCYNNAIAQCTHAGMTATSTNPIFLAAYNANIAKILWNLDPAGLGANQELRNGLAGGSINPRYAADLPAEDLNPLSLAVEKAIITRRENLEDPTVVSRRYRCRKCGESSTRLRDVQIRCGDEGSTGFADCTVCGYSWVIY